MPHSGLALIDPHVIFEKIGLQKGMRVADFGCGRTGHFVFSASRHVAETGVVYAVDILKDVLENIKSRIRSEGYDNVQTVWSDIERLGKTAIPTETLDSGFFVNVISRLHNQPVALSEARRLLKKNGLLAIIEWAKPLGTLGPDSVHRLEPVKLQEIARVAGFRPVETFPAGEYHYCTIFRKEGV
jgi:ubiquinone/menaquinone biosynthesis C-methylase UbiE